LDTGEGDKRISLDLEPDKKPGQLKGKKIDLKYSTIKHTNK
jgi:hypothetical protein